MRLIAFDFTKIHVEKFQQQQGEITVNTNIDITSIEEIDSPLKSTTKELVVKVKFNYTIDYNPQLARIDLSGYVLVAGESKEITSFLKEWEAKKSIPNALKYDVFNLILRKTNVKALELEEDLNLPTHLPLPTIKKDEK